MSFDIDKVRADFPILSTQVNGRPLVYLDNGASAQKPRQVIDAIKAIDPEIMVEQAAGITSGQQVYDFIMAGSEAAGAASGIMNANDPFAMIDEMIAATRRAADDLKKETLTGGESFAVS